MENAVGNLRFKNYVSIIIVRDSSEHFLGRQSEKYCLISVLPMPNSITEYLKPSYYRH